MPTGRRFPLHCPIPLGGDIWQTLIDTAEPDRTVAALTRQEKETFPLYGRSLALLRTIRPEEVDQELSSTQIEQLRRQARRPEAAMVPPGPLMP